MPAQFEASQGFTRRRWQPAHTSPVDNEVLDLVDISTLAEKSVTK